MSRSFTRSMVFLTASLATSLANGAALNKYSLPSQQQAPVYQQTPQQQVEPKAIEMERAISEKQRQALKTLRALPRATQEQWIAEFKKKAKQAAAQGQYSAAAYYQGIIDAWKAGTP